MWWILLACSNQGDPDSGGTRLLDSGEPPASDCTDADADGSCAQQDCDDSDWTVYPGAPEVCDDLDNDCDGQIDEDAGLIYYTDDDRDGYGDEPVQTCEPPDHYADNGADCDDGDDSVYPGAPELADGQDNDCDGEVDEGADDDPIETEISLSWNSSGLRVSITGSASRYELGMAETGAGSSGWFGETCIPGDEPRGYNDYGYDVCHTLSASGGTITYTGSLSDIGDGRTLFYSGLSDDITYFIADTSSTDCWVTGHDPSYYDDFGCEWL